LAEPSSSRWPSNRAVLACSLAPGGAGYQRTSTPASSSSLRAGSVDVLPGVEQEPHPDAAPVGRRQRRQHLVVGEHEDLGPDLQARAPDQAQQRGSHLVSRRRLHDGRAGRGPQQRARHPTRQAPVLLEDRPQALDLGGGPGLQAVIVVAGAGDAPVHASDQGPPVDDQQLDVVDLVAAVIERVGAGGYAEARQAGRRPAALRHRRVVDEAHVEAVPAAGHQSVLEVGASELVHLHQHPRRGAAHQAGDRAEDGRVLPQPHRLGRAGGREQDRHRRRRRDRAAGEEDREQG